MAENKPTLVPVEEVAPIAKPAGFSLDKFKSKRAAAWQTSKPCKLGCHCTEPWKPKTSFACTRMRRTTGRQSCASSASR